MLSILLLDENTGVDESFLDFKKIYKYQRVSKIYQQILEAYSEVCGDTGNIIGQKATSVVSFYSPIEDAENNACVDSSHKVCNTGIPMLIS